MADVALIIFLSFIVVMVSNCWPEVKKQDRDWMKNGHQGDK